MNKAITDGIVLMPPSFGNGLNVWSSGDGTPGSDTYDIAGNAAFVPADQDFAGCLELQKIEATQKLRYTGETPLLPGCYLQITARVKAMSGPLPNVRVAGWAGGAGDAHVAGVPQTGPQVSLTTYGEVVTVRAIVGSGTRNGVDMPWGTEALYGHFGIDLTGPSGGIVRIDDIEIEDVTEVFHRDMMNWVDVRDFGAVGDGVTEDQAAFEAADAAANGRRILVSRGLYFLGDNVTLDNPVQFEGTVTMPTGKILSLTKSFDLPTYIAAFGNEELGFKKAFQSLLNNADHESLDMGGRRVSISGPIDMQAAVANKDSYAQRRHIRNGQFYAEGDSVWDTEVVTSQATYSPSDQRKLTNVANVANIPVGALVEGNGVGREVYVRSKNEGAQEITLSQPLFDAAGTQNFTFKRFKYLLDFSGFAQLSKFSMSDIEFQCNNKASGIMLADSGLIFHLKDCYVTRPKDRGITSKGEGCQGMLIDRCQFITGENGELAQNRKVVVVNTNANDVKLRNNRSTQFRHFAVISGSNSMIMGNHIFQGDGAPDGTRTAGIVLADNNCNATVTGNYIDNCFLEWTNEHDPTPAFTGGYSFSALNLTDNVFLSGDVAPWFAYIVVKPFGAGHFLSGVNITGNMFRSINGAIDRVERVDTSFADLDRSRMRNIHIAGNMFNAVEYGIENPITVAHSQNTEAKTWVVDCENLLPFGGWAQNVVAVQPTSKIKTAANVNQYTVPYIETEEGPDRDRVHLVWEKDVRGDVAVTVRMDN